MAKKKPVSKNKASGVVVFHRSAWMNAAHLVFIFCAYLALIWPVVWDPRIFPVHDNLKAHLLNYLYFSNSLKHGFGMPLWYNSYGGTPIGMTATLAVPFFLHRLLFYGVAFFSHLPQVILYKMNLAFGVFLPCVGWWFVLCRLTRSRLSATVGCLMILWGGVGITVFQQELEVATLAWVPWVILAFLYLEKRLKFVFLTAVLLGILLTSSYPQIHLIWMTFALGVGIFYRPVRRFLKNIIFMKRGLILGIVFILMTSAVLPSIYLYLQKGNFSSPVRGMESLEISSLDRFMANNRAQRSSATWEYLKNYISPRTDVFLDQYAWFVTVAGMILAVLGVVFCFRTAIPILCITLLCAWAMLGINGYLAQIFFLARVPLIQYFRQWGHFFPIVNLGLSALGAIGISVLLSWGFQLSKIAAPGEGMRRFMTIFIFILVVGSMWSEGRRYFNSYTERWLVHMPNADGIPSWNREEFLQLVKEDRFALKLEETLFVYKRWFRLYDICPGLLFRRPFGALAVYNVKPTLSGPDDALLKTFCGQKDQGMAVMATLPPEMETSLLASGIGVKNVGGAEGLGDSRFSAGSPNYFFPEDSYIVSPSGMDWRGPLDRPYFVVLPFAHELGLKIFVNGARVDSAPVFDGAFTGVFVPAGKDVHLSAVMPVSFYHYAVLIQYLLLALAIGIGVYDFRRSRWPWLEDGVEYMKKTAPSKR